ncbi:alpha/beta hydrolase [Frankia sp. CNm7]|uniref:Alpha/beta hydrolase n=1 Tax=Frankia nepalensis TaxID=1836974 RepID=A0A937RHP0_9ACTN|nr:alpha/beta hydrolase [Frankia nepalensis]MBL7496561.1 alpha/beta hydrolase [Frankia nepalensis]MBL7508780.1 alpha/beta hydrolase [Frankia nepalensis]MBL7520593.1 alpha/beta hydrolase [Frankia nepalensis]MBL7627534.1 alpha/beta hydrolase [Frankia nepalensis]
MKQVELSGGTIEYTDSGGEGPVLVLLHGLLMDASLWDGLIAELSADHRCVAPTLPMGAHRHPAHADADLSLPGMARQVGELLDRLDLTDVTLVGNDTGGAVVQLVVTDTAVSGDSVSGDSGPDTAVRDTAVGDSAARVGRIVLVSCEAFDNFPAGLTEKTLVLSGKLPPALFGLFMQQMRLRILRRLPLAFGWLTIRGDAATARWLQPILRRSDIRRDTVRLLRALANGRELLLEAAARLPGFDRPALVAWAADDRVMPPEHGRRLAELLPQGRLVAIPDSYTLVPLDQPERLAQIIREFTASRAAAQRPAPEPRRSAGTESRDLAGADVTGAKEPR